MRQGETGCGTGTDLLDGWVVCGGKTEDVGGAEALKLAIDLVGRLGVVQEDVNDVAARQSSAEPGTMISYESSIISAERTEQNCRTTHWTTHVTTRGSIVGLSRCERVVRRRRVPTEPDVPIRI